MTYNLYCIVNAIGIPYNDTFRDSEGKSKVETSENISFQIGK